MVDTPSPPSLALFLIAMVTPGDSSSRAVLGACSYPLWGHRASQEITPPLYNVDPDNLLTCVSDALPLPGVLACLYPSHLFSSLSYSSSIHGDVECSVTVLIGNTRTSPSSSNPFSSHFLMMTLILHPSERT